MGRAATFFIIGNSLAPDCFIAEQIRGMTISRNASGTATNNVPDGVPHRLFATTRAERLAVARRQFFEDGVRPTGLVGEAVIQSWLRCVRNGDDTHRIVAFDAVTPSRLHATMGRNRALLDVARGELTSMESSLSGTDCRVLLTDAEGVLIHATRHLAAAHQPVLRSTARVGVNIAERVVGTTAPGIVALTGLACTVDGAEHYYDCLREMHCAAAPIHDVHGRVAAVLDLSVESRRFGFDAASMVGLYATMIENRLLLAQSQDRLVLRFQADASLLGTPLEALAGVAPDGSVAWLNAAGGRLIGRLSEIESRDVKSLFGLDLPSLLRLVRRDAAQQVRLACGLGVWLQARLRAHDGVDFRHAIAMPSSPAPTIATAPNPLPVVPPAAISSTADATLQAHTRKLIEDTLAAHGGNISLAARTLRVSRGTLYRRMKSWRHD